MTCTTPWRALFGMGRVTYGTIIFLMALKTTTPHCRVISRHIKIANYTKPLRAWHASIARYASTSRCCNKGAESEEVKQCLAHWRLKPNDFQPFGPLSDRSRAESEEAKECSGGENVWTKMVLQSKRATNKRHDWIMYIYMCTIYIYIYMVTED